MKKAVFLSVLVFCSIAFIANLYADVVKLRTGVEIKGIAREEKGKVIVEMGRGVVTFERGEVEAIDKNVKSELEDYLEKYQAIKDSKNADAFYKLAAWAKKNKVTRFLDDLLKRTIELNPNHAQARQELGYIFFQEKEKWLTKDEYMKAKGFILFKGKWVTSAEKELILACEREAELKILIAKEEARLQEEENRRKQEEIREKEASELKRWDDAMELYPRRYGLPSEYTQGYNRFYYSYGSGNTLRYYWQPYNYAYPLDWYFLYDLQSLYSGQSGTSSSSSSSGIKTLKPK